MQRYFRIEEAEQLLPKIEPAVRELASLKSLFDETERELRSAAERITLLGGANVDREKVLGQRGQRDALASRLQHSMEAVQQHGCLVKDLDLGLIDFPTFFKGQEVYLCWKLGEASIGFWHGVQEGFRGRKPIDRDFLDHHGGEAQA